MFPLSDSHPTYRLPIATIALILVNVSIFVLSFLVDPNQIIGSYALIPSRVNLSDIETLKPFITSQFLHAGFMHIISNMWFLKVFGDNVEEKFGSFFFVIIYLLSGAFGAFLQYLFSVDSTLPMLGASAAVSGVLGSYIVFFPNHRIRTLVPFGFFVTTVNFSAYFMLAYWFFVQLFSGIGSIVVAQTGGVAFWAHVGGFVSGWFLAKLFLKLGGSSEAEEGEILDF